MVTNNSANIATGISGTVLTGNGIGLSPTFQALGAASPVYFQGYVLASDTNTTGDGTVATLGVQNPFTIVSNQGNAFTTGGVFTAPVSGIYALSLTMQVGPLTTANNQVTGRIQITGVNAAMWENDLSYSVRAGQTNQSVPLTIITPMAVGDTAFVKYSAQGGAKTTGTVGAGQSYNAFGGYLISGGNSGQTPGLVLIETQVASNSAALQFTTGISSTFDNYLITFSNVKSSGASTQLVVQLNSGSGYINVGYQSGYNFYFYNSNALNNINSNQGFLLAGLSSTQVVNGQLFMNNMTSGTFPSATGQNTEYSAPTMASSVICGLYPTNITVSSLQVICLSGNILQGTFSLYGIAQ